MAGNSKKTAKKGRPFEKGKSGNPSGRPKIQPEVKDILKAATVDAAKLLVMTINDEKAKMDLRIHCAEVVIDRVYGKASQPIELPDAKPFEIVIRDVTPDGNKQE